MLIALMALAAQSNRSYHSRLRESINQQYFLFNYSKKQAIYTKDCNLLVAAGAGSGKTAVLVERIVNKVVNEGIDIDKLLVVTFTNSAALEMRERLSDRLFSEIETNPKLYDQIKLLSKASITTIDSFCLRVVKDNFFKLGLDPNFRIGETSECELLKLEAFHGFTSFLPSP